MFTFRLRSDNWGHSNGKTSSDSEVLVIVYDSDERFIDSNNDSVSSSDNEIDDIPVADAITNDDSDDEEEIFHRDFGWEIMDNYTGHREVFNCDF